MLSDEQLAAMREQLENLRNPTSAGWARHWMSSLLDTIDELKTEAAEHDALIRLQIERDKPYREAWQRKHGKPHTFPDRGDFLAFVIGEVEHE